MNAKTARKQTIKMVAFNPTTRKIEEVYPESEVSLSEMSPRFWCGSLDGWVSIPGITAASIYEEWHTQVA